MSGTRLQRHDTSDSTTEVTTRLPKSALTHLRGLHGVLRGVLHGWVTYEACYWASTRFVTVIQGK